MSYYTDTLLRRAEILKNWRSWMERIAKAIKELLPDAEVYVIGSVARGDYIAASDVDVLIVSAHTPEDLRSRSRIKAMIEEELGLPYYHPFELHLLKPDEAQQYLRRAKEGIVRIA